MPGRLFFCHLARSHAPAEGQARAGRCSRSVCKRLAPLQPHQRQRAEAQIDRNGGKRRFHAEITARYQRRSGVQHIIEQRVSVGLRADVQHAADHYHIPYGVHGCAAPHRAALISHQREQQAHRSARRKKLQYARTGVADPKFYDDAFCFADGNPAPHGTPEEILAAGREMYHALSPETAEFIDEMFDGGLFDVLSKEGKAPGGYCTYLADYKAPFIFSNFNGTSDDVDVLTHEAGHAFAAWVAARKHLPMILEKPGMESCEIHSMSMEFLTAEHHEKFFGTDTPRYELAHAEDAMYFLPYGTMVDEFQHIMYAEPDLTPGERNAVWAKLESEYRPWLDFAGLPFYGRGAGWQRQLHIYEVPVNMQNKSEGQAVLGRQ